LAAFKLGSAFLVEFKLGAAFLNVGFHSYQSKTYQKFQLNPKMGFILGVIRQFRLL